MIASEIPNILKTFMKKENPYHCILIDGAWGIGKSYQIDKAIKAIKETSSSITISLFGITTVDEILTQLSVKMCSGAKTGAFITKIMPKLPTLLGEIDIAPIASIGKMLNAAVSPQIVLKTLLERGNKDQSLLIVFDDIERKNENLDMDLFLGSVETILLNKENQNLKVLFVANLEQMPAEAKNIWDRYSEKLIDRSYFVDELANKIEFFSSQKENEKALAFLRQHGCKNLRTLKKAENFFLDVKSRLESGTSKILQNKDATGSLRFACYATVLESVEKIYEQEYQKQKDQTLKGDLTKNIIAKLENATVEKRVCRKYLFTDELATVFAPYIIVYFDKGIFDLDGILTAYTKFIKGEKPVYYMSDSEVREHIEKITLDLRERHYNDLFDFLKKADEVYIWSEVMNLETNEIERMVSEEVPKEYEGLLAQEGKPDFSLCAICADIIHSYQMKNFLADFKEKETKIYATWLIKRFQYSLEIGDYTKVYRQLGDITTLIQKLQRSGKTDIISQFSKFFCNEWLLPVDSISENQYYCCQRSYALAMTFFPEQYSMFLHDCETQYAGNHMFLNRMKYIRQDYDECLHD